MQAHKLEAEGTAVKKLVQAHPAGKSFIKEHNGVVSLSSDPQPVGGCPLKFSGISPLFWDRIRSAVTMNANNGSLLMLTQCILPCSQQLCRHTHI